MMAGPGSYAVALQQSTSSVKNVQNLVTPLTGDQDKVLLEFATAIRTTPATGYSIESLSRRTGMYYKTLSRQFKTLFGETVRQYVHRYLMIKAKSLVGTTDAPLAEIAGELGYVEVANFCRAFKKEFGCTPSQFRSRTAHVQQDNTLIRSDNKKAG